MMIARECFNLDVDSAASAVGVVIIIREVRP